MPRKAALGAEMRDEGTGKQCRNPRAIELVYVNLVDFVVTLKQIKRAKREACLRDWRPQVLLGAASAEQPPEILPTRGFDGADLMLLDVGELRSGERKQLTRHEIQG